MSFQSFSYFAFLPAVAFLYLKVCPRRWQNALLLAASAVFYWFNRPTGDSRPGAWPLVPLAVLAAVLALPAFDLSGVLAQKHAWFAEPSLRTSAPAPAEEELAQLEGCSAVYTLEVCTDRGLAVALGRKGLATNISLLARGDAAALAAGIETVRAALEAGEREPLGAGVAFYTSDETFADAAAAAAGLRKVPFYQGFLLLAA